jgi:hypothetical protein
LGEDRPERPFQKGSSVVRRYDYSDGRHEVSARPSAGDRLVQAMRQ